MLIRRGKQGRPPTRQKDASPTGNSNLSSIQEDIALVASLKACAREKNLQKASILHAYLVRGRLLENNVYLGSTLVNLYAKCGALGKAQEVFDKLGVRNAVSWNALISGYALYKKVEEALNCLEQMRQDGMSPNAVTFVSLLRACSSGKAIHKGKELHAEIIRERFLQKDIAVGNALVDMYAKSGELEIAQEVFDELQARNTISWTALIAGYAQEECGREALNYYEMMQHEGPYPNAVTFTCILKACSCIGALNKGEQIHAEIVRHGLLQNDALLGSAMVDMYIKCGVIAEAEDVFEKLQARDVVTWTTLIAGYVQHGYEGKALNCFEQMEIGGLLPNTTTFVFALKACGSTRAVEKGTKLHARILKEGLLEKDILVGNALVEMYSNFGVFVKAQEVFDALQTRDVVSWTALLGAYGQQGQNEEVLNIFNWMHHEGLSPNVITFIYLLKVCGSMGSTAKGNVIHSEMVKRGLVEECTSVSNALVYMYAKSGAILEAQEVFNELIAQDLVSWNVLLAGFAQHGYNKEALYCYEEMLQEGFIPNAVTFVCILKCCGSLGAIDKGKEIHNEIVKEELLEKDIMIGNALLDMYVKCGSLSKAQEIFNNFTVRDVISWNTLIAGYAQYGLYKEAIYCYESMQRAGFSPNVVTFACSLKACGNLGATDKGKKMHAVIVTEGLLEKDILARNSLVDMYVKCGALENAQEVLNELQVHDAISWTTIIEGYVHHGQFEKALQCFNHMQHKRLHLYAVTFACILKACGSMGVMDKGIEIQEEIVREGWMMKNILVGNALVDMYVQCGALRTAQEVFDELPEPSAVSWTSLIEGYAQHGHGQDALNCFHCMQLKKMPVDNVTFIVVLNACSHSGLLEEGHVFFKTMSTHYSIGPNLDHYSCMVDLYGRAGHFSKATELIEMMPTSDNLSVWTALLAACRKWGNVNLGKMAFDHAMKLEEKDESAYVCLSNIYFAAGMQEESEHIEAMRVKNKAGKKPGCLHNNHM